MPEDPVQYQEHGTYVLVIELVDGALDLLPLDADDVPLFKISEINNTRGDPETAISRARGLRVYESGGRREIDPAGTLRGHEARPHQRPQEGRRGDARSVRGQDIHGKAHAWLAGKQQAQ